MTAQQKDLAGGQAPFFSIVIPVLDGGSAFRLCLSAISASSFRDWELIVVDDGSVDGSAEEAQGVASRVLVTTGREGPAAARNLGARQAKGDYLVFIDADCTVYPETLALAAARLQEDPTITALFGSYDDCPAASGTVSAFKNLQHHHVHQSGEEEAETFWAGCGAIRRADFLQLGGFDAEQFARPSIEDIELGIRLRSMGGRIVLAKEVQVTHHKRWTLGSLLRTDLFDRGIPWVMLLSRSRRSMRVLNLSWRGRSSVLLGLLILLGTVGAMGDPGLWLPTGLLLLVLMLLNRSFLGLLFARGGLSFLAPGILLLWIYQLNCALALVLGKLSFWRESWSNRT